MSILDVKVARVFKPLLYPARIKGAYGGRGSGKSHFFGEYAMKEAVRFPSDYGVGLCLVCIREVQRDLKHSAKKLIEDKLQKYGLLTGQGFTVFKDCIKTPGDGIILFQGMQDHNADSIKSLESFHRSWVEEAHTLSARSLELLRPTMRWDPKEHDGSAEMWFSWNPNARRDPVDMMFRDGELPTGAVCVNANYQDNPWFPNILEIERKDCLKLEPDQYAHVWDGDYVGIRKGAYFAHQLTMAHNDGRISNVSQDPLTTIKIYCDIGGTGSKSDAFTMWAAQSVGREIRVLDYYEAQGQELGDHVGWLNKRGYSINRARIVLPHDGATFDKVHRVSYESSFRSLGYSVEVIPNQGAGAASKRIEEARRLFPMMWFDRTRCAGGLEALRWYHEKLHPVLGIGLGPEHDWSSHAADAFGMMAVAYRPPVPHGYKVKVNSSMGRMR